VKRTDDTGDTGLVSRNSDPAIPRLYDYGGDNIQKGLSEGL
jgi:hypothetical protein